MCSPGWATAAERRTTAEGSPARVRCSRINLQDFQDFDRQRIKIGTGIRFANGRAKIRHYTCEHARVRLFYPPILTSQDFARRSGKQDQCVAKVGADRRDAPRLRRIPRRRGRLCRSSGSFRRNNPTSFLFRSRWRTARRSRRRARQSENRDTKASPTSALRDYSLARQAQESVGGGAPIGEARPMRGQGRGRPPRCPKTPPHSA